MNETILCTDTGLDSFELFDLSLAPDFLFYAYIPMVVLSLLFGVLIGISRKKDFNLPNKIFFFLALVFSLHLMNELMQWIVIPAGIMNFGWSTSILLHALIAVLTLFFTLTFALQKPTTFKLNFIGILALLPIILLLPTKLNVIGFDVDWCGAVSGPLWNYLYILETTTITALFGLTIWSSYKYFKTKSTHNSRAVFLFAGASIFSLVFFGSELVGDLTYFYEINLIGPLGMLLFLTLMTFLIVKYGLFNIKMLWAKALIFSLIAIMGGLLFLAESTAHVILVGLNLVLIVLVGHFLILGVKKETKQKEELEKLTGQLKKANKRLKLLDQAKSEFVSIASHQLRSPLTSIRGYASMLLEGSYGKLPEKGMEAIERISESSRYMAMSVEDYLNVSRIEAGRMKYEMSDFNLKEMAEHIVDDLRPSAIKKGLVLSSKTSDLNSKAIVHADIGKTQQIIHNLIDNAMKYTPKGTITVRLRDNKKKKRVYVDVIDSGVGMDKDSIDDVFEKFIRARNANKVNVTGTGLGLFVAKQMAEGMKGTITAHSDGEGKGSTFTLELPLQM